MRMNGSNEGKGRVRENADGFLERVRRALAHDLRTPLGTIANYAAILEYHGETKPADVRVFAGRIRQSAVRAAVMLQHITDAILLAERRTPDLGVDPSGLVRALLTEMTVHVRFPVRGEEPHERVPFDPDLLAFAWRAFLAVNAESAGERSLDVDIEVQPSNGVTALDMWIGTRPAAAPERAGTAAYTEGVDSPAHPESCFALGLAEDLIHIRGGEMGLWGRPGQASNLRIAFPQSV
jgi:signal transduction histidine kinase